MDGFTLTLAVFAFACAVTVGFGVYLTMLADQLAERTKLGRVFVGAVLLGAITSLAEIGTSLTAALSQHAELAASNAIGSIAAQTAWIAVADLAYRRANLEHAAASAPNLMLTALLLLLIGVALAGLAHPAWSLFSVHPASFALIIVYLFGLRLVSQSGAMPMWRPHRTTETNDESRRAVEARGSIAAVWCRFVAIGGIVAGAGSLMARTGIAIAETTGLSESFVGALMTGVISSMPELITAITAVRIGALTLAVSNIVGGNAFDAVIVAIADFAYRPGPIFLDVGANVSDLLVVALLMNAVLLLGLLRRERHGVGNIGLEGVILLGLYAALVYSLV